MTHLTKHGGGVTTALSARTYIENVVVKFETMFASDLRQFQTPMDEQYHPETDDSPLLDRKMISQFRALVGSANWVLPLVDSTSVTPYKP